MVWPRLDLVYVRPRALHMRDAARGERTSGKQLLLMLFAMVRDRPRPVGALERSAPFLLCSIPSLEEMMPPLIRRGSTCGRHVWWTSCFQAGS